LEAKRAVVLDKPEKAAATLMQQLNAIRNAKAEKRRAASNRWVSWVFMALQFAVHGLA
jgi:hypothetical protein